MPLSIALRSAFRFNIHQSAPVASQASARTECTIWPVSKPSPHKLFSNSRSSDVENINGAGVLSREEKSGGIETSDFSRGACSDSVDDTERRFVRTGVRIGIAGGPLLELCDVVVARDNEGRMSGASGVVSMSEFSSSWTLLMGTFSNRETMDLRRVASLACR